MKNQQTQTTPPFEVDKKPKQSAIPGKYGKAYSTVRHLARLGMKKAMEKQPVKEAAKEFDMVTTPGAANKDSEPKHRVSVTVSDPQHTMVSKRHEKIEKRVRLHANDKEHAVTLAKHHFKRQGYKVHDAQHIGITEASEQIAEISNEVLQRYKEKAGAQVDNPETPSSTKYKRGKGHLLATIKQMKSGKPMPPVQKEEVEMNEDVTVKKANFKQFRQSLEEKKLTPAEMKKREEVAKAIERENPNMPVGMKMAIATKTAKRVAESVEQAPEGMHYCAKHVRSALLGDGVVLEAQHAEPDVDGSIEWYMVEFKDGIHKVFTEDLEIMIAEYHGNHKKKKRMTNG